jgi:hypothetical protein
MALRDMMYAPIGNRGYVLNRQAPYPVSIDVTNLPAAQAAIAGELWRAAIETLRQLGVHFTGGGTGDGGELLMTFASTPAECNSAWGFCEFWPGPSLYFTRGVRVVTNFESRPHALLRGLVSVIMREGGANPLPGMMNREQPASELSLLEQQAIKMAFIRTGSIWWPDTDQDRLFD